MQHSYGKGVGALDELRVVPCESRFLNGSESYVMTFFFVKQQALYYL